MKPIFILLCLFVPFILSAQTFQRGLTAANGEFIGFYENRPGDYETSNEKYPLIIFLHGVGEKGNGKTQLKDLNCCGIPAYIKRGTKMRFTWNGKTESFIVLYPQLNPKYGIWQNFYTDELINYATKNLRIDPDRIFLTGLSLGGGGTWTYASASQSNASKFAGIAPVVAPCFMSNGCNIAKANLPVMAIHSVNDIDAKASCTINALRNINACTPSVTPNLIMYPNGGHYVWVQRAFDTAYNFQSPNIYEWMLAQNRRFAPNKKPSANAGSDMATSTGTGSVTLSASGSWDPDGSILRYAWKKISGPAEGVISGFNTATANISGLSIAGTYKYELKVVDSRAEWTLDTVTVNVATSGAVLNQAPMAVAGGDVILTLPSNSTMLSGGASSDPDGSISHYLWSKINGPGSFTIDSPLSVAASISNLVQGVYTFRLMVTDNRGAFSADDINITVNMASGSANLPPVANAGADKSVDLSYTHRALINGTLSTDPDGWINSFSWSKISGPSSYTIVNAAAGQTFANNLEQGVYVFRVTVTDNKGATSYDDITVTAEGQLVPPAPPAANLLPLANAGHDRSVDLSYTNRALINATLSTDPDGWVKSFGWSQISGPACSILNAASGLTFANNIEAGVYVFRVMVTDNKNAASYDDVTITVTDKTARVAVNAVRESDDSSPASILLATEKLTLFPNPASSAVYLQYNASAVGKSVINIYDVMGKKVKKISFEKGISSYQQSIDLSNLVSGLYHVEVLTGDKLSLHTKLIKQ